jgi:molybdenum cofactor cytidylyltransferase
VIFGELPLTQAEGAILAHSHRLPGRMLRKGAVLDAAAIAALREAGRSSVIAARLGPDDVPENEAAARLAETLITPQLQPGRAGTGRVNLHAAAPGLLRVDATRIDALNLLDESLTVATLPDLAVVAARGMVATIKAIPFSVPGRVLEVAEAAARTGPPALSLHPFRPLRAGLVLSELPGLKESVIEGTIAATRARVTGLTGTLLPPLRCPHEAGAIAASIGRLLEGGAELVLVVGASATVDRRDVGPQGIVAAGGEIVHFGMPVDPGNLICLGRIGAVPALVLPGCARSPKANGIDWVLYRIFADQPIGPAEIMRMGVGGLLKDTDVRPLPRARATETPPAAPEPRRPGIAAIVLAAGQSTRMAPHHKLLVTDRAGKPMIARVVDNVLSSRARPVLVVVGHRAEDIRAALGGRPVIFVDAPDFAVGLSASLKAGLRALRESAAAALVCLGDMPLVTGRIMDRLIDAWDPDEGRAIVVPTHKARQGNPILWDRSLFPEMLDLAGDVGARALLARHAELVAEVDVGEDAVLRDFDTVESLATLPARLRPVEPV